VRSDLIPAFVFYRNRPIFNFHQTITYNLQGKSSIWKHRGMILKRVTAKAFFKLLGRYNTRFQPNEFFSIKPGYRHAVSVELFDDTANTDEWQKEVYELVATIAQEFNYPSIIDVGCGSAYKLVNMLGEYDTVGIEVSPIYEWLRKKYPTKKWLRFDETAPSQLHADLVICADVIEHIDNPDNLLDFIDEINFQQLLISTPERDAVAGRNDFGPPENPAHYREWNAVEFKNYLRRWFVVKEQRIFNDKSITQVVICQKKK